MTEGTKAEAAVRRLRRMCRGVPRRHEAGHEKRLSEIDAEIVRGLEELNRRVVRSLVTPTKVR